MPWPIHPSVFVESLHCQAPDGCGTQRIPALMEPTCCVLSHFSCVQLFATPWTVACRTPLPMAFSRQEYWSGLQCLPPENPPGPGIEPTSLTTSALADRFFTTGATWEAPEPIVFDQIIFHQTKRKRCQVTRFFEGKVHGTVRL